jgi:hypothetical protein
MTFCCPLPPYLARASIFEHVASFAGPVLSPGPHRATLPAMTQFRPFGSLAPEPRQVAVVGSRDYGRLDLVRDFVLRLPKGSTVISGGARGVDQQAANVAKSRGLKTVVFHPDWQKHGRAAGLMRNVEIVAHAKQVIAFWNGRSRGIFNTIVLAHRAGRLIVLLDSNGDLIPEEVALRAAVDDGIVVAIERAGLANMLPPRPEPRGHLQPVDKIKAFHLDECERQ